MHLVSADSLLRVSVLMKVWIWNTQGVPKYDRHHTYVMYSPELNTPVQASVIIRSLAIANINHSILIFILF